MTLAGGRLDGTIVIGRRRRQKRRDTWHWTGGRGERTLCWWRRGRQKEGIFERLGRGNRELGSLSC